MRASGTAANSSSKYARTPSGATMSAWPCRRSTQPGFQQATIASTSRAPTASK